MNYARRPAALFRSGSPATGYLMERLSTVWKQRNSFKTCYPTDLGCNQCLFDFLLPLCSPPTSLTSPTLGTNDHVRHVQSHFTLLFLSPIPALALNPLNSRTKRILSSVPFTELIHKFGLAQAFTSEAFPRTVFAFIWPLGGGLEH